MKICINLLICVFLCGCIAKNANKENVYLLTFNAQKSQKMAPQAIFIQTPKALLHNETKFILAKNGVKIDFLPNAKFMILPTQMLKDMIFSAFDASAKFEPKLQNSANLICFDAVILDLYIDKAQNSANFAISYEIRQKNQILQKGAKFSQIKIKSNDIDDIIASLNSAVNLALSEIVGELESVNLE